MMKKQTILVCIAVGSTCTVWLTAMFYEYFIYLCGWDFIVNAICVWMMFDAGDKYWELCRKRGVCRLCYNV